MIPSPSLHSVSHRLFSSLYPPEWYAVDRMQSPVAEMTKNVDFFNCFCHLKRLPSLCFPLNCGKWCDLAAWRELTKALVSFVVSVGKAHKAQQEHQCPVTIPRLHLCNGLFWSEAIQQINQSINWPPAWPGSQPASKIKKDQSHKSINQSTDHQRSQPASKIKKDRSVQSNGRWENKFAKPPRNNRRIKVISGVNAMMVALL